MAHLFKHSTTGALLQLCTSGKISFSRKPYDAEAVRIGDKNVTDSTTEGVSSSSQEKNTDKGIVTWSGENDPDNPQNWPTYQKVWITVVVNLYTFALYIGSSLYVPSEQGIMREFGVTYDESVLGLALYVLGYGLGCLLLSPLSEVPAVGRNPPTAVSGLIFVALCIPTALVDNYPGLIVLRFILGLMASPPMATSGAILGDIWSPSTFPFAVGLWATITSCSPALGPTIAGFAVKRLGWRFSAWEMLIVSGPIYLLFLTSLPETSGFTILHYQAKRLREETGNYSINSEAEVKQKHLTVTSLVWNALLKPWEMNIKDPALLFTSLYFALLYAIYYTFFESLPLVFPVYYGFTPETTGLIFLCTLPAGLLAFAVHAIYMKKKDFPKLENGTFGELENFLVPGMVTSWLIPIGLFLYAWTSRPSVHWIAPTMGLSLLWVGMYFVSQAILAYIPRIYPRYAASIFALSSFVRSTLAFAAVMFARPMFEGMGVSGGVSLLGGLTVVCCVLLAGLWRYGKWLRSRSSFAVD